MAYAAFEDVKARAGRVAGAFSVSGKHPNQSDIEVILADCSAMVDSAIRSRGFDPDALSQGVADALKDLVAYGALSRGLAAIDPTGRPGLSALKDTADAIWAAGLLAIENGTHEALLELEAGTTGPSAGALWTDDPDYGQHVTPSERLELNEDFAPGFARTQKL
jgi:hypothetical protein